MAISTFKRYEIKYLLSSKQFDGLLSRMTTYMEPDEYCQNGKTYSIYNIYYDTWDHQLIRNSLAKPFHKEKLRLRSYRAPAKPEDLVFLEMKEKTGGLVHKRRASMALEDARDFIECGRIPESGTAIENQVIRELDYFLRRCQVQPMVYIGYRRMAFFGKEDHEFRVTFDQAITTRRDQPYLEAGNYGDPLLPEGQLLMEIKISHAVPLWLAEALSELNIYKTNFSKYGVEYQNYLFGKTDNHSKAAPEQNVILLKPGLCVNY